MKITKFKNHSSLTTNYSLEISSGFAHTPTLALLLGVFNKVRKTYLSVEKKSYVFFSVKRNKNTIPKLVSGFTLVETIIYVAIFSMLIGAIFSFVGTLQISRTHNQLILEVNDQGSRISRIISSTIHSASSINSPTASSTATILSLVMASSTINPTVFSVGGDGVLYITEGAENAVALTNNKVSIDNLLFENYSKPVTPGVIRFSFIIKNTASSTKDFYSNNFYGSGAILR